jgi:hypothetical protein
MCGGGGDQTVTQRQELDPALQRLLYGGALGSQHGLNGGARGGFRGGFGGGSSEPGGFGGGEATGYSGAPAVGSFSDRGGQFGTGALYAMGGPVNTGIASMANAMPMGRGVPMMNGRLPNLSNPQIAATLAMAQQRPDMMRGFATGGYVEGPGTGTSDSIPATILQNGRPVQRALLSDGEFVMTEKAVRNAGEGDRERGAARMYEMMRMFERGGRV